MKADATNQEWNKVEANEKKTWPHQQDSIHFHSDKCSECYSVKWIWALNTASDFICMRLDLPGCFFFWLSFCSCVPVVSALQFSDSPFYLRNKLLTLFFPRSLDRIWFIWLQRIYRMEFTDSFSLERAAESKKWKKKLRIVRTPNAMWKFTIEINKLAYSFSNGNQLG